MTNPRVVFDCMVYLQGAASPAGPARACLRLVDDDRVTLCTSEEILREVREVLNRPRTLRKFPALSAQAVDIFVRHIEVRSQVIVDVPKLWPLPRDPRDEPYLNLALVIDAEFLISRDRDLLDLMHDQQFRARYPKLKIVDPASFLREMSPPETLA